MRLKIKENYLFILSFFWSISLFLSLETGRSISSWGINLWIAFFITQIVVWCTFFFRKSNLFLFIIFLNLNIILFLNFITTPLAKSLKEYYSLPKNMNIKMMIRDETMFGFEKDKSITIKTDNKGFRVNNNINYKENKKTNRIVLIGGSQVEEIYLNLDETWGSILAKNLSKKKDLQFDLVNTGVSGLRVEQLIKNLSHFIDNEIEAKHFFFLFGQNDWNRHIVESNLNFFESFFNKFSFRKSFIMKIYTLINFELNPSVRSNEKTLERYGKKQSNSLENRKIKKNRLKSIPSEYKKNVMQIINICKKNKKSCIFLESVNAYNLNVSDKLRKNFWQTPSNTDYSLDLKDLIKISELYNNWLNDVVVKNGFIFCKINKYIEPSEKYFYDDSHFNKNGSNLVADIVTKCIEKKI